MTETELGESVVTNGHVDVTPSVTADAGTTAESVEVSQRSEGVQSPTTHPADAETEEIRGIVQAGADKILRAFEERSAVDRFRESQIDKLHAELQVYKTDLVAKATRPLFQSLVRLHDDMGKLLDALDPAALGSLTPERMLKLLRGFQDDVETALDQNGVSVFRGTNDVFDARREKVLRTVETTVPAQVGQIAARVRPGFERDGTLLEKERVAVYVLARAPAGADASTEGSKQ